MVRQACDHCYSIILKEAYNKNNSDDWPVQQWFLETNKLSMDVLEH